MDWQIILITLAILSFEIGGAYATTIVSNTLSSNAGTLEYNVDYSGGTMQGSPVESINCNNNFISYSLTGININPGTGADKFHSYMKAFAKGDDEATAVADIRGSTKIVNYDLFGYVTPNLAYAGQYADSIQANYIVLGTYSDTAQWPNKYAEGQSQIVFEPLHSTDIATATNVWEDAMAGGSRDPSAFPNGIWAMANLYTPTKLSAGADPNDYDWSIYTSAYYQDGLGHYMGAGDEPILPDETEGWDNFIDIYGKRFSMTMNSQSMGYADSKLVYANLDMTLAGQEVAPWFHTYSMRNGFTNPDTASTSIDRSYPTLYSKSEGAFLYSLVDLNNLPQGKSDLIFY